MSRFDLFFVVTDQCSDVADSNIANHIVAYHQLKPDAIQFPYTMREMQNYIKYARTIDPVVSAAVHFFRLLLNPTRYYSLLVRQKRFSQKYLSNLEKNAIVRALLVSTPASL
jgi:hypothetical protein